MAKSKKSKKSKGGSSILVIIAVLALLAAIGVAIYKLTGQHGGGNGGSTDCSSFKGKCNLGSVNSKNSKTTCKTQQCTAQECCTPPACTAYTCTSGTKKSTTDKCVASGCTDTICCDKKIQPTITTCPTKFKCGDFKDVDTSKQCKKNPCTQDECCSFFQWAKNKGGDVKKEALNLLNTQLENCGGDLKKRADALQAAETAATGYKCPPKGSLPGCPLQRLKAAKAAINKTCPSQ